MDLNLVKCCSYAGGPSYGTFHSPIVLAKSIKNNSDFSVNSDYQISHDPKYHSEDIDHIKEMYNSERKKIEEIQGYTIGVGGDHTVTPLFLNNEKENTGLVWIDAHCDFHTTKTSRSGNVHGMVVAGMLDLDDTLSFMKSPVLEKNTALIGARDVERGEIKNIKDTSVNYYPKGTYDSIVSRVNRSLSSISEKVDNIHVSVDVDIVDPKVAPGVSVPARSGLSSKEFTEIARTIADFEEVNSVDIVELNVAKDKNNSTLSLSTKFVENLLRARMEKFK